MAVGVYIANTRDATEVCIDSKATKQVAFVNYSYPGAVPVRVVGAGVSDVLHVSVTSPIFIVAGETIVNTHGASFLLESGDYILMETGDTILLEN